MNPIHKNRTPATQYITAFTLLAILLACLNAETALGQTKPPGTADTPAPLNLNDETVSKEISAEMPVDKKAESLSAAPDKFAKILDKDRKYRGPTKIEEIYEQGSTDRVEKVTTFMGDEYCVYSPTQGRVDGIDSIKDGMQFQVRTCPHYF